MPMQSLLKRISPALGLMAFVAAPAWAQGPSPSRNQATADAVAAALRPTANETGVRLGIEVRDGVVTLSGTVADPVVKGDLVAKTLQVAGVTSVSDRIRLAGDSRVRPVQYQPAQVAMGYRGPVSTGAPGMMGAVMESTPAGPAPDYSGPMPEGSAGMVGYTQAAAPGYPNYSWPNCAGGAAGAGGMGGAGVSYPTSYPWQAWTNGGPGAPYPEIPLAWKTVTLRWDDGLWWLDFKKHYYRPFFTPWPFGIWAY
jgi:hypothetical protein